MRAPTVVRAHDVPWWGVVSSAATPVLQIGGWSVAASLQPQSFDSVKQSVSALAGQGAADRWVMTLTFIVVAICYIATAVALRPAALAGRLVLIAGALAGLLVAANPEAAPGSFSLPHALWSALGFALLAAWPLGAYRGGPGVPWALRPNPSIGAVAVIVALTGWFLVELLTGGAALGLAERLVGFAQAAWPLIVVASCHMTHRHLSI